MLKIYVFVQLKFERYLVEAIIYFSFFYLCINKDLQFYWVGVACGYVLWVLILDIFFSLFPSNFSRR